MAERPRRFSPVLALLTMSSVWDAQLGAALKDLGLTTRKYALLGHIYGVPGVSFSELARMSQITVQTAHTAVRTLVSEGFVHDSMAHAGAASELRVTERGTAALMEAEKRLRSLDRSLTKAAPELSQALKGLHEQPVEVPPVE
ncbi:hypothetical protein GCM10009808_14270 [Microbacterium sediminicola]|uniref:HTH marR-type domain-containing protein n=1 Tax=Microbacterium sediminicola TaxID=415210 RepID=A0ABP4U3Y4_9MICO